MQNAVIYARYSSHSQRDVSIDQQVNACREFAARGGIDVLDVYADRATTGTNDRRPAFQKMISDAKKRGVAICHCLHPGSILPGSVRLGCL